MFSFLITSCDKEEAEIQAIYENPGYALGTVSYSTETTLRITYYFEYYVYGTLYTGGKTYKNSKSAEQLYEGDMYLVVYDLDDPSISHLNTKYYFENDLEFDDMIRDFEYNPPTP